MNDVAVNRLDRLTSGLMIMALTGPASRDLAQEFAEGTVKKQYVARVKGRFPEYVRRLLLRPASETGDEVLC